MSVVSTWYNSFRSYLINHHYHHYNFLNKHKRVVKFIITGSLTGGSDLVLLYIFHGFLKINIVLATSLAFILVFLLSFSLQKFWTFRNRNSHRIIHQLVIYLINAFWGLTLNGILMYFLVNRYHFWYLLAQIIINLVIGSWNFFAYKHIIFRDKKNEIPV